MAGRARSMTRIWRLILRSPEYGAYRNGAALESSRTGALALGATITRAYSGARSDMNDWAELTIDITIDRHPASASNTAWQIPFIGYLSGHLPVLIMVLSL
jgi:hypothetical protein